MLILIACLAVILYVLPWWLAVPLIIIGFACDLQ